MPVTIKVHVPPDLIRALDGDMRKVVQRAGYSIGTLLERELHRIPEAPASAGRRQWYKRGFGPKWRSNPKRRWKRTKRNVVYGSDWAGIKSSEGLSQRSFEVKKTAWGAIVGTPVTYSPLVQHYKDQTRVHKRTGWVTDKQAADRVVKSGRMDRIVKATVKRVLKGMG